jgi:hypothetical protein
VTEPEPTTCRYRFPWVQLVFCIACLSMAAWMWMRYSYCWQVGSPELDDPFAYSSGAWPVGAYVEVLGRLESREFTPDPDTGQWRVIATNSIDRFMAVRVVGRGRPPEPLADGMRRLRGRVHTIQFPSADNQFGAIHRVDTDDSRLHGASVAGLVVGAMGVFIFGLYLRRWLSERKALARQPGQHMIA